MWFFLRKHKAMGDVDSPIDANQAAAMTQHWRSSSHRENGRRGPWLTELAVQRGRKSRGFFKHVSLMSQPRWLFLQSAMRARISWASLGSEAWHYPPSITWSKWVTCLCSYSSWKHVKTTSVRSGDDVKSTVMFHVWFFRSRIFCLFLLGLLLFLPSFSSHC